MSIATHALVAFRRGLDGSFGKAPLPAVFVMEPSASAAAAVTASWCPVSSVQVLDATRPVGVPAVRSTIDHAVGRLAARTIVLCGEGSGRPDQSSDRELLFATGMALLEDPTLASTLRSRGVTLEVLWFDRSDGDIYRWDPGARRFELLADEGLHRFLLDARRRAVDASPDPAAVA